MVQALTGLNYRLGFEVCERWGELLGLGFEVCVNGAGVNRIELQTRVRSL